MDANGLLSEIDSNFEPHSRTRSNTWPCRPAENFIEAQNGSPMSDEIGIEQQKDISVIKQKTSSRRNAWGNLSYADLITKAIQSSPEQRLTLSQIYDWMVQNVPYFKDKGDNTSSAGWKNSIRHNLSLHSRFMRVQNEGTGKSSWWVINPDAKPGKAPRRRAGSMETKSLEKKRGRIKKRIEAIRAGQENGSISNEDFQDMHFNSFSPEFRTRAGSNASSGRLSPIQAAVEPDLQDGQVPPMSPIPWGPELDDDYEDSSKRFSLVDSLVGGLNIHEAGTQCLVSGSNDMEMDSISNSTVKRQLLSGGSFQFNAQNNYDNFGNLPAPPSYNDHIQQQQSSQQSSVLNLDTLSTQSRNYLNLSPNPMYPDNVHQQQHQMTMSSPGTSALGINTQHSPVRSPQLSPSHYSPHNYIPLPQPLKLSPQNIVGQSQINHVPMNQGQQPQQQMGSNYIGGRSLLQQCLEAPNDSMLRAASTQHMLTTYQAQPVRAAHPQEYGQYTYLNSMTLNNQMLLPIMGHYGPNHQVTHGGHLVPAEGGSSLAEIDTNNMLDLDYDVEQLLRHELEMDANLDFNFESANVPTPETKRIVR